MYSFLVLITDRGIKLDSRKSEAVIEFKKPTNVKGIKLFLGLSGYYRKLVESYSAIVKPLTNLLKKNVNFLWIEECQKAFDE